MSKAFDTIYTGLMEALLYARGRNLIEIYSKENCQYCTKAKAYLDSLNIEYVVYDIGKDETKREEMLIRNPSAKSVPQIFQNGMLIGGYTELTEKFF